MERVLRASALHKKRSHNCCLSAQETLLIFLSVENINDVCGSSQRYSQIFAEILDPLSIPIVELHHVSNSTDNYKNQHTKGAFRFLSNHSDRNRGLRDVLETSSDCYYPGCPTVLLLILFVIYNLYLTGQKQVQLVQPSKTFSSRTDGFLNELVRLGLHKEFILFFCEFQVSQTCLFLITYIN